MVQWDRNVYVREMKYIIRVHVVSVLFDGNKYYIYEV